MVVCRTIRYQHQVKQALLNVLLNALDTTDPSGAITVSTSLSDSKVRLTVRDTGSEMSADLASEVFKPFFTTKTRRSSLGLACVERILSDHRGDVSMTSKVGNPRFSSSWERRIQYYGNGEDAGPQVP